MNDYLFFFEAFFFEDFLAAFFFEAFLAAFFFAAIYEIKKSDKTVMIDHMGL
ncbi:MAG TPA: hypothetical protein VG621_03135 [Candidatus Paceibacterota bacterium]|nr:hypothetical protein [Candidatus Paceibacterota bacterium]